MSAPLPERRGSIHRHRLRVRLTATYGLLLTLSGSMLVAITYFLVRRAVGGPIGVEVRTPTVVRPNLPDGRVAVQPSRLGEGLNQALIDQRHHMLSTLVTDSLIALALVALASLVVGWFVAGRMLRPLAYINATAREISEYDLHRRLRLPGPANEITLLGDTIDGLLGRLEAAFDAQRRFIANVSHELRSPLARARVIGQLAVTDPAADVESLKAAHERILRAQGEEERIIDALLALALGQAGPSAAIAVDLAESAATVIEVHRARVDQQGIDLDCSLAPAIVDGDPVLLERLITNLVDNAIAYNEPGGRVGVTTRTQGREVVLVVVNEGQSVPAEVVADVREPFRRLDGERTNDSGHLGLGLSIVDAVAHTHGGRVLIEPNPKGGLSVTVSLPEGGVSKEQT